MELEGGLEDTEDIDGHSTDDNDDELGDESVRDDSNPTSTVRDVS